MAATGETRATYVEFCDCLMERVERGVLCVLEAHLEAFHTCTEKKELHPHCWRGGP